MFEVMTSEASYLRSLNVLRDHFLGSRELDNTLVIHDKKSLFSNILQVHEVSQRLVLLTTIIIKKKNNNNINNIISILFIFLISINPMHTGF